jgi:hypothetical protein
MTALFDPLWPTANWRRAGGRPLLRRSGGYVAPRPLRSFRRFTRSCPPRAIGIRWPTIRPSDEGSAALCLCAFVVQNSGSFQFAYARFGFLPVHGFLASGFTKVFGSSSLRVSA